MSANWALVRALVDWMPRSATWVGALAGPLVIVGYLVGSIPFGYLISRRRLRRQLDRPSDRPTVGPSAETLDTLGVVAAAVLAGGATLAIATVAWDLALAATPGGSSTPFSAVGAYSNQVLGAWVSVALWTGLGASVGHAAPVWSGFRGGSGVPAAVALVVAYVPLVFVASVATFLVAFASTRRLRSSFLVALPVAVTAEYTLWLADQQAGWGVTNGPELALWVTVLAGVLFAGNVREPTSFGTSEA